MNKQNIGILCTSTSIGGLELNTLKLASWLREYGWTATLLVRAENPMIGSIQSANVPYHILPPAKGARQHWKRAKAVATWLKQQRCNILLTPFNKDLRAASICKRYFRNTLKLIYQQHMQVGVSKRDFIHRIRYAAIDAWISPLPYLKEETIRLTTVAERKISIIPFGIEAEDKLSNNMPLDEARAVLALPEDGAVMGILGRIDRKKGQDFVVKALQKWNEIHPKKPFHLLINGDATLEEEGVKFKAELGQLITDAGLDNNVSIVPYTKSTAAFFRAIDVFVMPTYSETFGMVTLEAMAAGVPVLGSNSTGTMAILQEGRLGHLFTPGDADDFCRQLEALLGDKDLLEKLRLAREEVITVYSKQAMMLAMDRLLKGL